MVRRLIKGLIGLGIAAAAHLSLWLPAAASLANTPLARTFSGKAAEAVNKLTPFSVTAGFFLSPLTWFVALCVIGFAAGFFWKMIRWAVRIAIILVGLIILLGGVGTVTGMLF